MSCHAQRFLRKGTNEGRKLDVVAKRYLMHVGVGRVFVCCG